MQVTEIRILRSRGAPCGCSEAPVMVSGDRTGVTGHAGSRLLVDLADRLGLTAVLDAQPASRRVRRSAHDPGWVLRDVAVMLADGGTACRTWRCYAISRRCRRCSGRSRRRPRRGGRLRRSPPTSSGSPRCALPGPPPGCRGDQPHPPQIPTAQATRALSGSRDAGARPPEERAQDPGQAVGRVRAVRRRMEA